MFRVKHFVREAEILREDVRTTIENATAKRASTSRKPGRLSDDIVVPNVGGFLSRIDLWYYTTASEDSRTLNHFGQIGEANQDELIAENMVKLSVLSVCICLDVAIIQIMLELDDLIDISNPSSRPDESEQKMARCPKTKGTGMKLTVMVEELGTLGVSENRKEAKVGPDKFRLIR